jgi:hypothetical protein
MALTSAIYLLFSLGIRTPGSITFYYGVRLLFVACAIIVGRIRKSPNYYLSGLREMPDAIYWYIVSFAMLAFGAVFAYFSIDLPPVIKETDSALIVGFVFTLLIAYQTKPWAVEYQKKRIRRIQALTRKARLSSKELEVIVPALIDNARKEQQAPISWRIITGVSALILGLLLTLYAGRIVDLLSKVGFLVPFVQP